MQTKSWVKYVTTCIFGIYCVDTWLMCCVCITYALHPEPKPDQHEFCCALADELIDNNISRVRNRRNSSRRVIGETIHMICMLLLVLYLVYNQHGIEREIKIEQWPRTTTRGDVEYV